VKAESDFILISRDIRGFVIWLGEFRLPVSRREHAPWASQTTVSRPDRSKLRRHFYNNCFKNGSCRLRFPRKRLKISSGAPEKEEGYSLTADLPSQTIHDALGLNLLSKSTTISGSMFCSEGLDDIGLTLKHEAAITAFEQSRHPSATMYESVTRNILPVGTRPGAATAFAVTATPFHSATIPPLLEPIRRGPVLGPLNAAGNP